MARRDSAEFMEGLRAVTRCLRSVAAQTYATFEVGSTQAKFLRYIGDNTRISQAELARATATDPALTGRVLETLIERDWVSRSRSADDRRQYVLELTTTGRRVRKRVEEARSEIAGRIAGVLNDRDVEDFDRIAKKILAAFEESSDDTAR